MTENKTKVAQKTTQPQRVVALFLYDGMPAIEAVGPYEALSLIPNVIVKTVAETAGAKRCDSGMLSIVADYTLDEVPHPDVVVIPGGNLSGLIHNQRVLSWLKTAHETALYTTALCVGTLLLGAAGLLNGVRVTTLQGITLPSFGEIRVPGRVVIDGKIVTATNAAIGLDLGICLASLLAGEEVARAVQVGLEYDVANWQQPFTPRAVDEVEPAAFQKFMELMQVNPRWAAYEAAEQVAQ